MITPSDDLERVLARADKFMFSGNRDSLLATWVRNNVDALRSALANYDKLHAFAKEMIAYLPEGAPDGGDLQDAAVKYGLLIGHEVTEPCGENCNCAGYGDDWPMECFRMADFMRPTDDSARAQEAGK